MKKKYIKKSIIFILVAIVLVSVGSYIDTKVQGEWYEETVHFWGTIIISVILAGTGLYLIDSDK